MAIWCLTKQAEQALLEALKKDGDPQKMVDRGTEGRLAFFTQYVGEENAKNINALFEKRLLLKNQQKGFEGFVKQLGGSKQVQRNFLSKVNNLNTALSKKEVDQYLNDYISQRLGLDITQEEFEKLTTLSKNVNELETVWKAKLKEHAGDLDAYLKTHPREKAEYGASRVLFENYGKELAGVEAPIKTMATNRGREFKTTFKANRSKAFTDVAKDATNFIADNSIALVATLDNSFIGRQGLWVLFTHPTKWAPTAVQSFVNIAKTLGGKDTIDALMADVYSDPEYLDGSYQKAGILPNTEEQFPTEFPVRLPGVGRLFKASHDAFTGSAIKMRTDLYKLLSRQNTNNGVNMKDPEEIRSLGVIINSLTARGNIGKSAESGIVKLVLWAPRMLKSSIDVMTAHFGQDITPSAKRHAKKNLIKIIGSMALILGIAKALDPDSVEFDTLSSDFGKLKIGKNHETRIDITRGAGALIVLASRIAQGKYKDTSGQIHPYGSGYGQKTELDAFIEFVINKNPPLTGAVVDYARRRTFAGTQPTLTDELYRRSTPISIQNLIGLKDGASADKVAGIIFDFLGFNSGSYLDSNIKSGIIPENTKLSNEALINQVTIYAKALKTDPETAFNRIFTGQKITKVNNGTIIVERMPVEDSQLIKKKANANNPTMKLDHTIPLELGGSNDKDNLKLVTTSQWSSYTPVENALAKALKEGKIDKKTAQTLIVDFKAGKISKEQIAKRIGQ